MKVLGRNIKVKIIDGEWEERKYGMADPKKGVIYLADDLSDYILLETLLHEVIHIICDAIRIEIEEEEVHRLGFGLYHFLQENQIDISRLLSEVRDGRKKT